MTAEDETQGEDERLDRAIRLFEFLARVQQIKSHTPRTIETYERDGDVIWFHALPNHPAINTMHRAGGADPLDPRRLTATASALLRRVRPLADGGE